ncbi:MAG: ABC transporter permease [Acidobacteriaceae bacterium]|nr:ABC transporter permease [Acidobacteriaceae bacterium]
MSWLQRLFAKKRLETQLQKELQSHVERQIADYLRSGMSEADARRKAAVAFGGMEQIKEECRDARGTLWLESTVQDIRYAARTLRKSPGFAIAAICTLALGIGANTAIFTVINGVILRALPYHDPSRLVKVDECLRKSGEPFAFSYPDFLDCQRQNSAFTGIGALRQRDANMTAPGEPEYVLTSEVSASFFPALGIRPVAGRMFRAEEDHAGAAPVVMIAYSLWQQRFGGRVDAIGKRLVLQGKGYTVIGVLPAHFRFSSPPRQIFTLIGQDEDMILKTRDFHPGIMAIARLKPGVTWEQADAELKVIGQRLGSQYPDTNREMTFRAEPLKQGVVGDVAPTLFLLAGAVGLVLLIACANVGNLFLTRSLSRTREFSIRAAIGAGRSRLLRQLLTESVLLSVTGGVAGLLLAVEATHRALNRLPDWLPRTDEISLDGRVLLFTLAVSVLTGVLFGLAPALRQRLSLATGLGQGARGTGRGILRLQSIFVVAELALALVLLTGAGLMLRTIASLWSVNPGFDAQHLLVMSIGLSPKTIRNPALMRANWRQTLERVQETPGVQAAALDSLVPLSGDNDAIHYWTSAAATPPKDSPLAIVYTPTSDYLKTMKVPLLSGRFFTDQDRLGSEPVIVVDQVLADRIFRGQDPVGRTLSVQWIGVTHIVGVIGTVKHLSLDEDADSERVPAIYFPFFQFSDDFMRTSDSGMALLVRTSGSPAPILRAIKSSVLGPDRDQPVHDVMTMEQMIADSLARRRWVLMLLAIFAGVALILASIGIYGVISYWSTERIQEVGIRMALGAQRAEVLRLFMTQGLRMVLFGIGFGTVAGFALTRLLKSLLYRVSPADPLTLAAVALVLASVATGAIYLPARRAAQIDPMQALRWD